MDKKTRLERLKAKAQEQLARPTKKLENASTDDIPAAARRAGRASKRAEARSRQLASRLNNRQSRAQSDSPAERAAGKTQMAPPVVASLEPTGGTQRLQDMARADRDPGREQPDQQESLVSGVGFEDPFGRPSQNDQEEDQERGPRVDDLVRFGSGGAESGDDGEEDSDPFGFETGEIGLSFDDDDGGGGLL